MCTLYMCVSEGVHMSVSVCMYMSPGQSLRGREVASRVYIGDLRTMGH